MTQRSTQRLEALDQANVHNHSRRLAKQLERRRVDALGRHDIRGQRQRHGLTRETRVRLVGEIVPGFFRISDTSDDANDAE